MQSEADTTTVSATVPKADNIFVKFEHEAVAVAKDVEHVVVQGIEFPAKAIKVVQVCLSDYPALHPIFAQVVIRGEVLANDVLKDVSEKGIVIADDIATWQALVAFFQYIRAVVTPAVEKAYKDINTAADITPA